MSISLILLLTVIITVAAYLLLVELPAQLKAARARKLREVDKRKAAHALRRSELENEQRQLVDLYIDTFILED